MPMTSAANAVAEDGNAGVGGACEVVAVIDVQPEQTEQSAAGTQKRSSSVSYGRKNSSNDDIIEEAIVADESLCQSEEDETFANNEAHRKESIFEPSPGDPATSQMSSQHATVDTDRDATEGRTISNNANNEPEGKPHPDQSSARPRASTGAIPKDVRFKLMAPPAAAAATTSERPTDLNLFDNQSGQPVPTQRTKRNRMQSVPNIKLNRSDASKLLEIRGHDVSTAATVAIAATSAATATAGATTSAAAAASAMAAASTTAAASNFAVATATVEAAATAAPSSSIMDMFKRFSKYANE